MTEKEFERELGIGKLEEKALLKENFRRLLLKHVNDCHHRVEDWSKRDVMKWAQLYFNSNSQPIIELLDGLHLNGSELLVLDSKAFRRKKLKSFHRKQLIEAVKHLNAQSEKCNAKITSEEDAMQWDNHKVTDWLVKNDFNKYVKIFKQEKVDGSTLIKLNQRRLDELGIKKDRLSKKLLKLIHKLASESNAEVSDESFKSNYSSKSPEVWTTKDVADWISDIGEQLQEYGKLFHENGIDGKTLMILDGQDLEEIGINKSVHRKTIMTNLQTLLSQNNISFDNSSSEDNEETAVPGETDNIEVTILKKGTKLVITGVLSLLGGFAAWKWKNMKMATRAVLISSAVLFLAVLFQRNYNEICSQYGFCMYLENPSLFLDLLG
eukprot:CAMPEP_0117814682 /NCGR_PEP_ID=MMETSP0948-20121206/24305_1 /TAXON_ID=44440 /ORGANISM="Chattonella subsalsa, Strain CCMP2191" /LENGTH=379 /DNA_ID=CAMNT_0005652387 /DNA_START=59 /DNA_END=1194 /DNA_ORIENTATION=-